MTDSIYYCLSRLCWVALGMVVGISLWAYQADKSMQALAHEVHALANDLRPSIEYAEQGLRLQEAVMTLAEQREGR